MCNVQLAKRGEEKNDFCTKRKVNPSVLDISPEGNMQNSYRTIYMQNVNQDIKRENKYKIVRQVA